MITDSMSKYEAMNELQKEFDLEVKPYYDNVVRRQIKPLIYNKAKRLKSVVNLGWEEYVTKNKNTFKILKKGNEKGDLPEFMAEFTWRNKKCYAFFFKFKSVTVFQKHCLERYAERVLEDNDIPIDKVINHIRKYLNSAFHIVLPTPTHPYSIYFVAANALFLGDYEDVEGKYKDEDYEWLNTCISLKEAHVTQKGVIRSLAKIQEYVRSLGFNPVSEKEEYSKNRKNLIKTEVDKNKLIEFLKNYYLFYQLLLLSNFSFTVFFQDKIDEDINFLKNELSIFSVHAESLSPYGKETGFAIKGEIDYRGKEENKQEN